MAQLIREGDEVFLADGEITFGSVVHAPAGGAGDLRIYVENAGEFLVPARAVKDVHEGKVILNREMLQDALLHAIRHAHDSEHSDDS